VYDLGSIMTFVAENGRQSITDTSLELELFFPVGIDFDGFEATIPAVGSFEFDPEVRVGGRFYWNPTGAAFTGDLGADIEAAVVEGRGQGQLRATARGDDATEFDRVEGRLYGTVGATKEIPVGIPRVGQVSIDTYLGPYVRIDPLIWQADRFPAPEQGTAFLGAEARGSNEAESLGAGYKVGVVGRFGGGTKIPAFDRLLLKGNVTARGYVQLPFHRLRFTTPIWSDEVRVAETTTSMTLRERSAGTPLPDGTLRLSGTDATAGNGRPAELGRYTRDGLPDESPSLAATDGGYLLAWDRQAENRSRLAGRDVFVRGLDEEANVTARSRVTDDRLMDVDPSVAVGEAGRLVAWTRVDRRFERARNLTPTNVTAASEVAVATADGSTATNWSAPTLVTGGDNGSDGAAVAPRVAAGDGAFLVAWRHDGDGDRTTGDDRAVRYATYRADAGLGPVRTVTDASVVRVAGDAHGRRVAFVRTPADANATVVVRNLTADTERRYPAGAGTVADLALTADSLAWTTESGPNGTVSYVDREGSVASVGTGGVSGVTDVGVATRRTVAGDRVDVLTFRGRPTDADRNQSDAAVRNVFYRVRRGGDWAAPRRLTPGGTNLAVWETATAGRQRGFLAVGIGRERTATPAEQATDLFYVRHEYGTDLNVSARATPTPATPGENLTVAYTVRNEGAVTARNATVTLRDGTGRRARVTPSNGTVAPGERVTGTVTVPAARSPTVTVAADATGEELDPSDDVATLTVMRPNLTVANLTRRPATDAGVAYDVTVRNEGPVAAPNASVLVTNDGPPVATASLGRLPHDGSATTTVRLAGEAVDPGRVTRVRVTAANGTDLPGGTGDAVRIRPPRPDAFVVGRAAGGGAGAVTPSETGPTTAVTGGSRVPTLTVLVGNRGSLATTASVTAEADDGTVVANATVRLPAAGPDGPAYRVVTLRAVDLARYAAGDLRVRVDPAGIDGAPTDNVARVQVPRETIDYPFTGPVVPGKGIPRDPDADGLFEDVDGDRTVSYADVVTLFEALGREVVREDPASFDFNGNGRVDFADLVELFGAL
jgi:hypothetical protein